MGKASRSNQIALAHPRGGLLNHEIERALVKSDTPSCTLCLGSGTSPFAAVHGRRYFRCQACDLTFLDPSDRPTPLAAREHYATHQNDPADQRYRAFLARIADPLVERLSAGARGLDFGSGPGPTLSVMLEERGFPMTLYDPFYAPDASVLDGVYDFVTCTETMEHFFDPALELTCLDRLLRPSGWLAVMTELLEPDRDFAGWRYARDPTHTSFYSKASMQWIAAEFAWDLETTALAPNVTLFRKR